MRLKVVSIIGAALLSGVPVASAINCDQVRRYLSTGRTVDEVAETMIVSVDEVKKCQAAAPAEAAKPGRDTDKAGDTKDKGK